MDDDAVREYLEKDEPEGMPGAMMLFVNPFRRVDGWGALGLGLLVVALTVAVAIFGRVHFDGVMDLHVGAGGSPLLFASEPIVDWLIVSLVFWAGAAIFSKAKPGPRAIDFFGMLGIGRLPFAIAGVLYIPSLLGGVLGRLAGAVLPNLKNPDQILHQMLAVPGITWFFVGLGATLLIMIWGLFLNFFAVKEASGMETVGAEAMFVGGTIAAEVVSWLAVHLVLLHVL